YLYAGILFFATLGAFSVNMQVADLWLLLLIGLLGFALRRFGLPVLPLILGVIIGPMAEEQLRKTFQLSAGEVSGLWSEPLAVGIYVLIAVLLLLPVLISVIRRKRGTASAAAEALLGDDAAGGPEPEQAKPGHGNENSKAAERNES
ncbi:MAG: tripartite tricarboxylate transporter permease, partial [Glutamicibacter sp.]